MKLPKKYLTANPNVMKREIKKHGDKKDNDPSAYKEWDADYKSRKAGKGKPVQTKTSKYTKKFKELYGENEVDKNIGNIIPLEDFESNVEIVVNEVLLELKDYLEELEFDDSLSIQENSPVDKALKNKSKKTGFPLGILRKVFDRGYAAWKKGHVPGTTPQQWGLARVNSFLVGGRTTKVSDGALYRQAKKNRKEKS
jgi:hypothetical protein